MARNATSSLELSVDAYCTLSQVQAYMPAVRTLTSSSSPTKAQAFSIIRDSFFQVNGLLDVLGYTIPVASSNYTAVRIIGRLNALCAAAAIEAAAYSAGNPEQSDHSVALRKQCQDMWTQLENGQISLPNATRNANYMKRKDEKTAYCEFSLDSEGIERDPTFDVDTNW